MATAGEIIRLVVQYTAPNGGIAETVHTYQVAGGDPSDEDVFTALSDFVDDDWGPDWIPFADTNCKISGIEADVLNTNGTVARNLGADTKNIVGQVTGDHVPAQVAALILCATAVPKTRGRKYIPYFGSSLLTEGLWQAGVVSGLAILLVDYFEPIVIAGAQQLVAGVLSRTLEEFVEFIQTGAVRTVPRTQRRRVLGVGQ